MKLGKLLIIVLAFLVVGSIFVMAETSYDYDTNTKTATIKEFIGGAEIASIQLVSPDPVYAIYGKDRYVGEIIINQIKDTNDFFTGIEVIDLDTGKPINRKITFKEKTIIQTIQRNYKTTCKGSQEVINVSGTFNVPTDCSTVEIESTIIENANWIDYDVSNGLPVGEITLGLFADVYIGDNIEWIPTFYKEDIKEWAGWQESYNVGLSKYYKFNNQSAHNFTLESIENNHTLTLTNLPIGSFEGGIENASLSGDGTDGYATSATGVQNAFNNDNITISWWEKRNTDETGTIISFGGGTGYFSKGATYEFVLNSGGDALVTSVTSVVYDTWAPSGEWYMQTLVLDSTTDKVNIFINGTLNQTLTADSFDTQNFNIMHLFANDNGATSHVDSSIDNLGFWRIGLTPTVIADLATGITYGEYLYYEPQFWNPSRNETLKNKPVNLSIYVNSTDGTLDGYFFSTNFSGAWANDSYTSIGGSASLLQKNILIPNSITTVGWKVWANDTTNALNVSFDRSFLTNQTQIHLINPTRNETLHNHPVNFSILLNDTGDGLSGAFFQTNNSGSLANTSWIASGGNINITTYETLIRNVNETTITWAVFANDSNDVYWKSTEQSFTTNDTQMEFLYPHLNSTLYNRVVNISVLLNDSEGLEAYVIATNFTGTWVNSSLVSLSETIDLAYNITTTPSFLNLTYGYIIYANETSGLAYQSSNTMSVTSDLAVAVTDLPDPVAEGDDATVTLWVNLTSIPDTNATLIWNNTHYTATRTAVGTNSYYFTRTFTVPDISTTTSMSYFWHYNITDVINSTIATAGTQEVIFLNPAYIINNVSCSAGGFTPALCWNFSNEQNLSVMDSVNIDYHFTYGIEDSSFKTLNGSLTSIDTACLCLNSTVFTNYSIGEGEIHYSKSGFVDRRFYTFSTQRATNETINNTLYLLKTTEATDFQFEFQDTGLTPYINKYTTLLHWYPALDQYVVVEMARTDDRGQTIMRVETEDIDYRIGLYHQSGILIKLLSPVRFASCLTEPCSYTVYVEEEPTDYTSYLGVQSQLLYNDTTGIWTLVWNDPSQATSTVFLNITKETGTGVVLICSDSASGYTGVLTCNTTGYTGVLHGAGYRIASPTVPFISIIINLITTPFKSVSGLLFSSVIFLTVTLAGVASPVLAIILGTIGFIPSVIMGSVSMMMVLGLAVIAGVIIHFITRSK